MLLALTLTLAACGQNTEDIPASELSFPEDSTYNYVELERLPQEEDADRYLAELFPAHEFTHKETRDLREDDSVVEIYSPEILWTYDSEFGEVEVYGYFSELTNKDAYTVNFLNNVNAVFAASLDLEGLIIEEDNPYEIPTVRKFVESREDIATVVETAVTDIEDSRSEIENLTLNLEIFSIVEGIENFAYFSGLFQTEDTTATEIIRSINDHRIRFNFTNQLMLDEYSEEEYASLHSDSTINNYEFRVIRYVEEVEEIYWEDLADDGLSKSSISIGTLYETIDRLDYETLTGDSTDFTFTGADESEYHFSLDFRKDTEFETFDYIGNEFYYLKDGEQVDYEEASMASISYESFEDMTDLFIRKFWNTGTVTE